MKIVLAPDKFKGTMTAAQVAAALADGIRIAQPDAEIVTVPVADGGDGMLDAFVAAGYDRVAVTAADALGELRTTAYGRRGDEAVVELAAVCGLAALGDRRAPLTATSRGVGEVIAAALDAGCTRIVLGIGGSASTDGGAGMALALGARITDQLDLTGLHARLASTEIEVACDVDNPLTGPKGAAAVYGPQKGATADDIAILDTALARWADLVAGATGVDHRDDPGAGAAGGVGFAAVAVLGGTLRPGVELVLDRLGFAQVLPGADLVVTGEGALDAQTLHGKAPAGVANAARAAGVPVVAVAGRCDLDPSRARAAGLVAVHTLVDEGDHEQAMTAPAPLLRAIGARIGGGS